MKRYVNCYPNGLTTAYHTAQEAKERAGHEAYAIAVEIELPDPPDPPHEWKVGDWFKSGEGPAAQIIDIHGQAVAYHWRENGQCYADWQGMDLLGYEGTTPCDPPAWFSEDGAS